MSLSTLLEAAKYLDYLDSNNHQQELNQNHHHQHQQQPQLLQQQQHQHNLLFHHQNHQSSQPKPMSNLTKTNKSNATRRQRFTKKNAANTMLAMSLPANTGALQMHGVPIPMTTSSGGSHQGTSLSSSFTTGSPLSSFASTALFCSSSKPSGVTSASSSAASSLSSSDSSSSCGEILMGDSDFNQSLGGTSSHKANNIKNNNQQQNLLATNNNHHNYHIAAKQQFETNHLGDNKPQIHQFIGAANCSSGAGPSNQSVARYIAATSTGPQLVTMTTSSASLASTSAPVDGNIRAGHIIHAANAGALINASPGTSFDPRHHGSFSLATSPPVGLHIGQHLQEGQTFNGSFGIDNHLSNSPTNPNCPPLIMTRVQPMILNSISPSAHHSIMAFQPTLASSPTSSSSSYSRHRELHKTLEKNRRAHLRHCFELLKSELPPSECVDKKTSHINIIRSAIRYVLALRQQEVEFENELHRLTKIKNDLTENLSNLNINQSDQLEAQVTTTTTATISSLEGEIKTEQPMPEQQLSFLLSQSKLD